MGSVTDFRHPSKIGRDRVSVQLFQLILFVASPDPGLYNFQSEFEIGRPGTVITQTKAGIYSFGVGRDKFEKVYMPSNKTNKDPTIPGPGAYTCNLYDVGSTGRKFAFQGRTINVNGK